jgi:hypothetical protein
MADRHHVVVDGSNLATEGRTAPSLAQLDEAVRAYAEEDPDAEIVVVVDATFEHRIAPEERALLEQAELLGEVVSPPAGAIGRGDAFVLRIAQRTNAVVLSNDSFQEFHGEHPWLFNEGRLVGGKPVPGVGWIFTPRTPVRGAKSRAAVDKAKRAGATLAPPAKAAEVAKAVKKAARRRVAGEKPKIGDVLDPTPPAASQAQTAKAAKAAKKAAKAAKKAKPVKAAKATKATNATAKPVKAAKATKAPKAAKATKKASARATVEAPEAEAAGAPDSGQGAEATPTARRTRRRAIADVSVLRAIGEAMAEAMAPPEVVDALDAGAEGAEGAGHKSRGRSKRRRRSKVPPPAVNEPLAFINFVATHPMGSVVEGEVASFTSHGAMVDVEIPDGGILHCYVPLAGLGSPPPAKAREVLTRGERRELVLVGLDAPRRMAELAVPEVAANDARGPRAVTP